MRFWMQQPPSLTSSIDRLAVSSVLWDTRCQYDGCTTCTTDEDSSPASCIPTPLRHRFSRTYDSAVGGLAWIHIQTEVYRGFYLMYKETGDFDLDVNVCPTLW